MMYMYERITTAKVFIDRHFAEEIKLPDIASEAHYSIFYFIKLFENIFQTTPHQYLIKVRMEHAKQLLEQGLLPSEVCYAVGFSSINSFTNLFKKKTGITPSIYQLQNASKKKQQVDWPPQYMPDCLIDKANRSAPVYLKKRNCQLREQDN